MAVIYDGSRDSKGKGLYNPVATTGSHPAKFACEGSCSKVRARQKKYTTGENGNVAMFEWVGGKNANRNATKREG